MRSPTLQFIVAGALVAAWAWMLGRPLLTNLFRRSRRDSVGHFRYQQAVLSRPAGFEEPVASRLVDRPRPIRAWRSQPKERRRLQTMLAFALATFFSMLLAIALRGTFVRLFLIMALCFVVHIGVAAAIGARELRRMQRDSSARVASSAGVRQADGRSATEARVGSTVDADQDVTTIPGDGYVNDAASVAARYVPYQEPSVLFPDPPPPPVGDDRVAAEVDNPEETFHEDLSRFGTGEFDEDFFEPIPELTFEPLNLDASILQAEDDPEQHTLFGPIDDELVAATNDLSEEYLEEAFQDGFVADLSDELLVAGDLVEPGDDERDESVDTPLRSEPTFTTPPQARNRPAKRNKARPIYIESQLDEDEKQRKAVGD